MLTDTCRRESAWVGVNFSTFSRRDSANFSASSSNIGTSIANRSPEMRAAKASGGRRLRMRSPSCESTVSPTCMPKLSLIMCS